MGTAGGDAPRCPDYLVYTLRQKGPENAAGNAYRTDGHIYIKTGRVAGWACEERAQKRYWFCHLLLLCSSGGSAAVAGVDAPAPQESHRSKKFGIVSNRQAPKQKKKYPSCE